MTVPTYDPIAEWYDGLLGERALPFGGEALLELAGDVAGQRICDLACGQGAIARHLADRRARAVGVDLSRKLLEIARRYERAEPRGIVYVQEDAQALASVRDAAFDGVVCSMSLMDIPDLGATLRAVHRVLRPGGWFVFSITHPCFQMPAAAARRADGALVPAGYFAEGFWRSDYPDGVRGKVGAYHRTLATYLNSLAEAGLALERILEPRRTDEAARVPAKADVPAVLVARCRKAHRSYVM